MLCVLRSMISNNSKYTTEKRNFLFQPFFHFTNFPSNFHHFIIFLACPWRENFFYSCYQVKGLENIMLRFGKKENLGIFWPFFGSPLFQPSRFVSGRILKNYLLKNIEAICLLFSLFCIYTPTNHADVTRKTIFLSIESQKMTKEAKKNPQQKRIINRWTWHKNIFLRWWWQSNHPRKNIFPFIVGHPRNSLSRLKRYHYVESLKMFLGHEMDKKTFS